MLRLTLPFLATLLLVQGLFAAEYPTGPDAQLTPGSLCTTPDSQRYPERINYCSRDVDPSKKWAVIHAYNDQLGYHIDEALRRQMKIDHFIPLCAGGSNNADNLWPQHESVYTVTDPVEPLVCQRMSEGKLTQKHAVELIRKAKLDLSQVESVMDELGSM